MPIAKVTSKGQITIPVSIRKHLHLQPGDAVDFFIDEGGTARMLPLSRKVSEVFGLLSRKGQKAFSVEEMNEKLQQQFRKQGK